MKAPYHRRWPREHKEQTMSIRHPRKRSVIFYREHAVKSRSLPLLRMIALVLVVSLTTGVDGQESAGSRSTKPAATKDADPFRWVNPLKFELDGVTHATFRSPSMNVDVGYCIYLPTEYGRTTKRFPVVYYLHGGRPGSETKSVRLASRIHQQIEAGNVPPMIYVFVNGGPVSHYNMPDRTNAMGADVFIRELIPHIDQTYRTVGDRSGRGIEGFSQGGRGTTRIMFRHPELFCSAAPGGAGHGTEKRISEEHGRESESLVFAEGDNTYDTARKYAAHPEPPLNILIHVGTKDFNYENNLEYMQFLDSLKITYRKLIVPDVPHSAMEIYQRHAKDLMQFHAQNFGLIDQ